MAQPPPPPYGILGKVHAYYRWMIYAVYDEFENGEFTYNDIHTVPGMKNFKQQQLRAWHNSKIVKNTMRKVEGIRQPVRVWRFTSAALNILRNPFLPKP